MLHQSFRVGLRQRHFCMSQTRIPKITIRSFCDDDSPLSYGIAPFKDSLYSTGSTLSHHSAPVDEFNHTQLLKAPLKSIGSIRDDASPLESEMATTSKLAELTTEIKSLRHNKTLQPDFKSSYDKLYQEAGKREIRYWMLFGLVTTALLATGAYCR